MYGLQVKGDDNYAIVYCGWNGEEKELYSFHAEEHIFGEKMCMSIIKDWLYFYDAQDEVMKRINTNDGSIVVIK